MSRKKSPLGSEPLDVARCKRIVRPLLAKIHMLNDMNYKYPKMLHLNISSSLVYKAVVSGDLEACHKSKGIEPNRKIRKSNSGLRIKGKEWGNKSDSDEDYEFGSQEAVDSNQELSHDVARAILSVVKPPDSSSRLDSLKFLFTEDLYLRYSEVFSIFRSIVSTLLMARDEKHSQRHKITRLSTLSSFKIGKFMALSTKSTFYKLNQLVLFDSQTMPPELKEYDSKLSDSIDHWLNGEPAMVTISHRADFLLGYVIHLVAFHSKVVLFALVPVLLHWLHEESKGDNSTMMASIKRTLFHEYWTSGVRDSQDIERTTIDVLNGVSFTQENVRAFWILFKVGYWKKLIEDLNLQSFFSHGDNYGSLMLDTLMLDRKINLMVFEEIDKEYSGGISCLSSIYEIIKKIPQHPNVNGTLINIIAEILTTTREKAHTCTKSEDMLFVLNNSLEQLKDFINLWLGCAPDGLIVFNSLYPGNLVIFSAIRKLCSYIQTKGGKVYQQIESLSQDLEDSEIPQEFIYLSTMFKKLRNESHLMMVSVVILQAYYLDSDEEIIYSPFSSEQVSFCINDLLVPDSYDSNPVFHEFLSWLWEKKDEKLLELAQKSFRQLYGNKMSFKNESVDDMRFLLFEQSET